MWREYKYKQPLYEDYKVVKSIIDYFGMNEFEKKRPPSEIETRPDEFDDYDRGGYIDKNI